MKQLNTIRYQFVNYFVLLLVCVLLLGGIAETNSTYCDYCSMVCPPICLSHSWLEGIRCHLAGTLVWSPSNTVLDRRPGPSCEGEIWLPVKI